MALINRYALSPLDQEEVFSFKVTMCANQVDRDFEVFPVKTLRKLQELFVGKTVVKDHIHKSDNQIARIYETYLQEDSSSITPAGEIYTSLIAKCYMIKTSGNADLIAEINAGIRKEVSLGCRITKAVCSVCQTDNTLEYCSHFPGKSYDQEVCYFKLEDPSDAYELSFVAIPAQKEAGTVKTYGAEPLSLERKSKAHAESLEIPSTEEPTDARQADEAGVQVTIRDFNQLRETLDVLMEKVDVLVQRSAISEMEKIEADGEIADFSDVLDVAEMLEEASDEESPVGEAAQDAETQNPDDEQAGEEIAHDEVRVPEVPSDEEDCSTDTGHMLEGEQTDAEDADKDLDKKGETREKLAQARLRNLDLSINLLTK